MIDARRPSGGRWVWFLVAAFAALHYDFWYWGDRTLWFGWLPAGLAYHAFYSIAAGLLWALVIRVAWPSHLEQWASSGNAPARDGAREAEAEHAGVER